MHSVRVFVSVEGGICVPWHVWSSEDNLWEIVLGGRCFYLLRFFVYLFLDRDSLHRALAIQELTL